MHLGWNIPRVAYHWCKQQLRYIKKNANSLTRGLVEQLNAENISSRYSDVVLPDGEPIHPHAKDASFSNMCDFPDKDINFSKVVMCAKFLQ